MAYREDEDLNFLQYCDNDDLGILVDYITKGKNGGERLTEFLTLSENYKKYYPNHKKYWREIAEEIQKYGGNTFANIVRLGDGVYYRDILIKVCKKMEVSFNSSSETEEIERKLIEKLLKDSLKDMSEEELKKFLKELNISTTNFTKQGIIMAIQAIIRQGGFKSYQILVIVANSVAKSLLGRGLSFTMNATLTKTMSILIGPIGLILTALWTMVDIAGPAYRVIIPVCIQVAYMRSKSKYKKIELK